MATKLQFKLEIFFYYLKKNFLFLIGGLLAGYALFTFWPKLSAVYKNLFPATQLIGVEGLYTYENLPAFITREISYGLTETSDNGKIVNSPLVESLIVENNNLDYIFTLKTNLFWHNGKKLISSDIDYKINGADINVLNDRQVKISVSSPFVPLTSVLTKPLIKKNLLGLADYKVKKIEYKDGYYKKVYLKSQKPNIPDKTYIFYSNEKDLVNAYKLSQIDIAHDLSSQYDFASWPKTKITPYTQSDQRYIAIFLNTNKLGNKQLRQALAYATPKSKDKNVRALGPVSPSSWAYNPEVKEYTYNPVRAQELYEKNKLEKINLSVTDRRLLPMAEDVKNSWVQVLGLPTDISIENQVDFENYDAIIAYATIPLDPDQYAFWHSTQSNNSNITKLNNERIDKLLEDGRQTFDPLERKQIYLDFQRYLLEESPAIFISYPTTYTINRTK